MDNMVGKYGILNSFSKKASYGGVGLALLIGTIGDTGEQYLVTIYRVILQYLAISGFDMPFRGRDTRFPGVDQLPAVTWF